MSTGNLITLLTVLVGAYYLYSTYSSLYKLMHPMAGVTIRSDEPLIEPLWREGDLFNIMTFLSTSSRKQLFSVSEFRDKGLFAMEKKGLSYNSSGATESVHLSLMQQGAGQCADSKDVDTVCSYVSKKIWDVLRKNSSGIYLHIVLVHSSAAQRNALELSAADAESGKLLYGVLQMVKHDVIPHHFKQRYLLSDFGLVEEDEETQLKQRMPSDSIISYWKPEVAIHLVSDWTQYPYDNAGLLKTNLLIVPSAIRPHLVFSSKQKADMKKGRSISREKGSTFYSPPLHADEIGLTSDKYVHLNDSITVLPLKISYSAMSMQRYLLMNHMEHSLRQQQDAFGFSAKDLDDVRRLVSETSLYLLGITVLASLLHLLFEFLAFQSDISFWKENRSLAGLSTRALLIDLFSQTVVLLFLIDSQTSLLVTIPSGVGILIQIWKVQKATGACLVWSSVLPTLEFVRWKQIEETDGEGQPQPEDTLAKASLEADGLATHYLGTLIAPLVVGVAARSILYDRHVSWYSWVLSTLTSCVYAGGFVMMCPQLFINHRLKSVSHLPWRYLCYKFLNTFIDDLFAFIIKMPTMHRLSVFRDDVVFLVYLYQRYIYRVDESRPIEK